MALPFIKMQQALMQDDQNPDNTGYDVPAPATALENGVMMAQAGGGLPQINNMLLPMMKKRLQNMNQSMTPSAPRVAASDGSDASPEAASDAPAAPRTREDELRGLLSKQQEGIEGQEGLAKRLATINGNSTNFAPLLGLIDSWTGSQLAHSYKAPPTEAEKLAAIYNMQDKALSQRQKLTSDEVSLRKSDTNSDSAALRIAAIMAGAQGRGLASDEAKRKAFLDRQEAQMAQLLDPTRGRAGDFGKLAEQRRRINALEALKIRRPDLNFSKTEMEELGEGLATVIKGGGSVINENAVKRILPSSFKGDVQDIKSWLKNDPQGREQQGFVKRLYDSVQSEGETVDQQIENVMGARLPQFYQLELERPQVYDKIVNGYKNWVKLHPAQQVADRKAKEQAAAGNAPVAPPPTVDDGKVTVDYNGKTLRIPKNRLQEAMKDGAKVIQ